jgi:tRNA(Ile)-lysidine synthase
MGKVKLESRVLNFINKHSLIPTGETVVVGVSGGADSVCLLYLLTKWQQKLGIKVYPAHLNHQLRGAEAEADARYVAHLTGSLDVPVTIDTRDVNAYRRERNCSLEEAARELRYDFLTTVAKNIGSRLIAVGHTRDDQVETILLHILRGAGTSGLGGLKPCLPLVSGIRVIRPLLEIARQETTSYCHQHELEPRSDSSNLSLSFLRNRLRLELLPLLKKYNPSIDRALLCLAEIADGDVSFIEQQALQLWDKVARKEEQVVYLDREEVARSPVALQRQVIRLAITGILGNTRDIEASHVEAIRNLLTKPRGKRVSLPHGLTCRSEDSELVIARQNCDETTRR